MLPISIIIITKNEAEMIGKCLEMSRLITDDIVIVDNGSTDKTLNIARKYQCRIHQETWEGYGANKNKGIALARYDWILSIDADEIPDNELVRSLFELDLGNPRYVYDIGFKTYFGTKRVRFGNWGRDHHVRLFHRKLVQWAESEVHETLILPNGISRKKIGGYLHHYAVENVLECEQKAVFYAQLSARQYWSTGKKATFVKMHLSPWFVFVKNYIVRLGFLDGKVGWILAKMMFKNTKLKYQYLNQYEQGKMILDPAPKIPENAAVEY